MGHFIVLTHKPRLRAALNKINFAYRLNCDISYKWSTFATQDL